MRKVLLLAVFTLSLSGAIAQTSMNIFQNNGAVVGLPVSDIDSIRFFSSPPAVNRPPSSMYIYYLGASFFSITLSNIDSITYGAPLPVSGTPPLITTNPVSNISSLGATSGGDISSSGGSVVTQRGVCYSTNPSPTIYSNITMDGTGTGVYNSNISGLVSNTDYYVRSYSVNQYGTSYGNLISFSTDTGSNTGAILNLQCNCCQPNGNPLLPGIPTNYQHQISYQGLIAGPYPSLTINSTGVTGLTATLAAGNFCGSGCVNNVTFNVSGTPSSFGTASFLVNIGGLSCSFTRVVGTGLSSTQGLGVTDIDGNNYPSVVLGNGQEWMAENLKTTRYINGDAILNISDSIHWASVYNPNNGANTMEAGWCYYNNDSSLNSMYGKLYNWWAVSDSRNTCPAGWHVPTDNEWNALYSYMDASFTATGGSSDEGRKMISIDWGGPDSLSYNESGFSGLPGGIRDIQGEFKQLGSDGFWWSATSFSSTITAYRLRITNSTFFATAQRLQSYTSEGLSVRCLKGSGAVFSLNCYGAVNNGTLSAGIPANGVSSSIPYISDGGSYSSQSISSSGVIGLTATLTAGNFANGNGLLTYIITGTPSRAGIATFDINIEGKSCSFSRTVIIGAIPGAGITFDGYTYQTLVYGNGQEWMAENLKTTIYSNGSAIPNVTDSSQWSSLSTGAWSYYNNDVQLDSIYGKLYNFNVVSDPRNVCPTGWHVPTISDWSNFVGLIGVGPNQGGLMKVVGTQYWQSPNANATNESGFSGLPGGYKTITGGFDELGITAKFWSNYLFQPSNLPNSVGMNFNSSTFFSTSTCRECGHSIRCIKN